MKTIPVKAIIITDGEDYIVHGTFKGTAAEMFKMAANLWSFDPSKETAHYIEFDVTVPNFEVHIVETDNLVPRGDDPS